MKTGLRVIFIMLIIFGGIAIPGSSYAASKEEVTLSGYINVRELVYFDGSVSYDYLVTNEDSSAQARYLLVFEEQEHQNLLARMLNHVGGKVQLQGILENGGEPSLNAAETTRSESDHDAEKKIRVQSIEFSANSFLGSAGRDLIGRSASLGLGSAETLDQVVAPARYSDINTKPHSEEYYRGEFYAEKNYSLAAYWRDASYGKFEIGGKVSHWVSLPESSDSYLSSGEREQDLVDAIDSQIDFDGANNKIENLSPTSLQQSLAGDDVDSIIGVYNGPVGPGIAGYGYIDPIKLSTREGTIYAYFAAIVDSGAGSPVGVPSDYFVGLAAHEMGHNLGWRHTASEDCEFCDPWSLMSGGIYSELGPSGPIAPDKESVGWIDSEDIVTMSGKDKVAEFTLDMLGKPAGKNYLMIKIPFGSDGHYYTVEARKDVVNDHTPLEQTGIVVYHHSPSGHFDRVEAGSTETIVDTTGIGDLANADIDPGDSFVDSENKITITNLRQNGETIVVRIVRDRTLVDAGDSDCNGLKSTIVGSLGPDVLEGTAGDDIMNGLGGNDVINGLGGNDIICGGWGSDAVHGGDGEDLVLGNQGNDVLIGDDGDDRLIGGLGDDRLEGSDGIDELFGWSGKDELLGGIGNDSLYGGRGDDYLFGGSGKDKLRGWLGSNVYADKEDTD